MLQLNELNEWRANAYDHAKMYKERTKYWSDKHIKSKYFEPGQKVLLFNSRLRLFPGKLKSRWSSPYLITQVFPHGAIELKNKKDEFFMVNGQRLKHYIDGEINDGAVALYFDDPNIS